MLFVSFWLYSRILGTLSSGQTHRWVEVEDSTILEKESTIESKISFIGLEYYQRFRRGFHILQYCYLKNQ